MEDHFLERISNLEDTLNNVLDQVNRLVESFEISERNAFVSRCGLVSLIETLRDARVVQEDLLNQRWETTMSEQMEEARYRERFIHLKKRFLALFRGDAKKINAFRNLIDEAEFFVISNRFQESTEVLKRAFAMDKDHYELAYYLAELAYEQGHVPAAKSFLSQALTANPGYQDGLVLLALIHYGENEFTTAKGLLLKAIDNNPADDLAFLCLGSILNAEGDFDAAEGILNRVNEIRPHAQSYYLLGMGAKEQGKNKDAIAHFKQAMELDPEHSDAIFALGLVYLERGWTRKARTCFSQAFELNPDRMEFRQALQLDQPDWSREPLEMDEESQKTFAFAEELMHRGKFKQALPHYRRLLKIHPDHHVLLTSFAVLNFSLRRFEEALFVARKILDSQVTEVVACASYSLQLEALRALGWLDEASRVLDEMRRVFPSGRGRVMANFVMAVNMAEMGQDLDEAERLAQDAVDQSPDEFKHNALDALAWVYFKQDRYEEALRLLELALDMGDSLTHLYHYGIVLVHMGLQDKALAVFDRALRAKNKGSKVDEIVFTAIRSEIERLDARRIGASPGTDR